MSSGGRRGTGWYKVSALFSCMVRLDDTLGYIMGSLRVSREVLMYCRGAGGHITGSLLLCNG